MKIFNILLPLLFLSTLNAFSSGDTLIVGVKITPPFIVKDIGGYSGLSIDLWDNIATKLNRPYVFKEYDLRGLLAATETGEVDICINPYTVTPERIEKLNFTQPFYISGMGVVVPVSDKFPIVDFLLNLFSIQFLKTVGVLFLILLAFGILIWLLERKHNSSHFDKGLKGVFHGVWWSAVTMTTVGYGDKTPKTYLGRTLGIIWMFSGIVLISSFTASITASLTLNKIQHKVTELKDLKKYHLGTVSGSSSARFLKKNNFTFVEFENAEQLLIGLDREKFEMAVYDAPVLKYYLQNIQYNNKLELLPTKLNTDYYSFSMPKNHPLSTALDVALISELGTVHWQDILESYNLNEN